MFILPRGLKLLISQERITQKGSLQDNMNTLAYKQALEWYLDQGLDEVLDDAPVDRFALQEQKLEALKAPAATQDKGPSAPAPLSPKGGAGQISPSPKAASMPQQDTAPLMGVSEIRGEALKLAQGCNTLAELKEAIAGFESLSLKKMASNTVFACGNPEAKIMVIGDVPGAEDDRSGDAFTGPAGQLLDRILACIGLSRDAENIADAVYMTNILNWRPPGGKTPAPREVEACMPFIERHIQLAQPEILVLCGGLTGKTLLGQDEGISRLRKKWHEYTPQCAEYQNNAKPLQTLVTYHPSNLLSAPAQKRLIWADMLSLRGKMDNA